MMNNLSFKNFMELQAPKPADYFSQIQDELGIDPDLLKKSPQVLSNFTLGGNTYNLSGYTVVDIMRDGDNKITAVKVQLNNDPAIKTRKVYKKFGDQYAKIPDDKSDTRVYTIPIQQFNQMVTQGLSGAGGGGLPGGGPMGGAAAGPPGALGGMM